MCSPPSFSGNTNGRFRMNGNCMLHNTFSYDRPGIFDPLTFELLVEVTDGGSTPRFSTTATVLVYVTPWTTTVPTTTTTTTVRGQIRTCCCQEALSQCDSQE